MIINFKDEILNKYGNEHFASLEYSLYRLVIQHQIFKIFPEMSDLTFDTVFNLSYDVADGDRIVILDIIEFALEVYNSVEN